MNHSIFEPGQAVVCLDDDDVRNHVQKYKSYVVSEVTHRGSLIRLHGVLVTLASTRFAPTSSLPPTELEVARASG